MSEVPLYGWYDTLALERSPARDAARAGCLPLSRHTLGVLDTRPSVSITVSDTRKCVHQCVRHARVCLSMCPTRLGVPITVYTTPQCVDTLALERSPPRDAAAAGFLPFAPPFAARPLLCVVCECLWVSE